MASLVRMSRILHQVKLGSVHGWSTRKSVFVFSGWRRSASTFREALPGDTAPLVTGLEGHGVNLGHFYVDAKSWETLAGWGYFEDGSVYMNLMPWGKHMDHARFEAKMRLLEPFIQQPPSPITQTRHVHSSLSRLIVIDCQPSTTLSSCTVLARNAMDGEKLSEERRPFRRCHLTYDLLNLAEPSSTFDRRPIVLPDLVSRSMSIALQTFRGTLIGGNLQPNVCLGNGLTFRNDTSLDRQKVEGEDAKEAQTETPYPFSNTTLPVGFNALANIMQSGLRKKASKHAQRRSHVDGKPTATQAQTMYMRDAIVRKREAAVIKREAAVSKREAAVSKREAMLNKSYVALFSAKASLSRRAAALSNVGARSNKHQATLHEKLVAFGVEERRRSANMPEFQQEPHLIRSASDYGDVFPELSDFDTAATHTRITLPPSRMQRKPRTP